MTLRQLTPDDLRTDRYERIGSVPIGDSWTIYGQSGLNWLKAVAEEEAPPGACGFFLGDYEPVLGSQVQWADMHFYKERTTEAAH